MSGSMQQDSVAWLPRVTTLSNAYQWVLMTMVGGLNDEDTKQAVLFKVEEMPLADTITFVEAHETGKQSLKALSKYFGHKGHGRNPNPDVRKAKSPASGHTCKQCGGKGHFKDRCRSKPKSKPEEDK